MGVAIVIAGISGIVAVIATVLVAIAMIGSGNSEMLVHLEWFCPGAFFVVAFALGWLAGRDS